MNNEHKFYNYNYNNYNYLCKDEFPKYLNFKNLFDVIKILMLCEIF